MTFTTLQAGTRAVLKTAARHDLAPTTRFAEDAARAVLAAQHSAKGRPVEARGLRITGRPLEVLQYAARGLPNKEIGKQLFISEDTVKSTLRAVFKEMGARDRAHAVAIGFATGLLSSGDVLPEQVQ